MYVLKSLLRPNTSALLLSLSRLSWAFLNADRATLTTGVPSRIIFTDSLGSYNPTASLTGT